MNDENDDVFWSTVGKAARPRPPETYWAAQRSRIMTAIATRPSPRYSLFAVPALAAACAAAWILWPRPPQPRIGPIVTTEAAPAFWDARLTAVTGPVTVFVKGETEGVPAVTGMPVEAGDEIRTAGDGRAELALSAESVLELAGNTRMTVSSLEEKNTLLDLGLGGLVAKLRWVAEQGRRLEVRTPTAVAAVRGTEFGLAVAEDGDTSVGVFDEGQVAVRPAEGSVIAETLITAHQEVRVPRGTEAETEQREGRRMLRVQRLSRLAPYRENLERVRSRHNELPGSWKELPREERAERRSSIRREHAERMNSMPPQERDSLRQRLRRDKSPFQDQGQGRLTPGDQGGGEQRREPRVREGGQDGQDGRKQRQGPGQRENGRDGQDSREPRRGPGQRENGRDGQDSREQRQGPGGGPRDQGGPERRREPGQRQGGDDRRRDPGERQGGPGRQGDGDRQRGGRRN
ncbi:MAG: hypothetical protein A2X36_17245 [Elusimicrobia bacterium GWA2_69_24]|nr:MAG: hypothetical protein A2X36_17245 [Elusimicrobia bacterium GWA2_69_24]